jgi:hypothetical protein
MLPDWTAFWLLMAYCGAALQDTIYIRWATKYIYPNFPILLVMPSGRGKTGGMNVIRPIFDRCLPYQIPEDSTAESAIRMLGNNARSRYGNSVAIWEVPELADVFGRKDYQQGMIARVTRLLDAPKDKEISRVTGAVQIRIQGYAVMNWLAGTTFEWLQEHVEDAVASGGFLPRLITLYTEEPPKWVPNPVRDEKLEAELNAELYSLLSAIGNREASIVELGDEWNTVSKRWHDELVSAEDSLEATFIARRQENLLRIYLITQALTKSYENLVMAETCSKWLEQQSVRLAEDLLLRTNPLMKRVLRKVEKHPGGISFSDMCRRIKGMNAKTLSPILTDLRQQGLVQWNMERGEKGIVKPVLKREE